MILPENRLYNEPVVCRKRGMSMGRQRRNAYRLKSGQLLLGWVVYFCLYYLTETCIPEENCHVIYCSLDDWIPFCELFVIFYVGWYGLIAFSLVYFLLRATDSFRKLQTYFIVVQMLATVVYILYPSRQELRPEVFPRENILTDILTVIYRVDTPTGICPSLHVALSAGIASAWLRQKRAKSWLKVVIVLLCLGVCASVIFVKQHSVLDILAAVPLCLLAEWLVFIRMA